MLNLRFVVWMFALGVTVLGAGAASSQTYPNKPIRIVTAEAGGGQDFVARLVAQGLSDNLGQSVIIENRGGSVVIQAENVTKALPDGYTLIFAAGILWIVPLMQNTSYDPIKGFTPISLTHRAPNVVVVHPSLAVQSVKELIALAKVSPGALSYASGPTGSSNHLAAELFKAMAGVNIVRIAYKGSGPALSAVIGGELQLSFPSASAVTPHIKSGRLKALAVTSAEPSALAPGLPTVAASGLPGYESAVTYGLLAPPRSPRPIINRLSEEIVRFLNKTDVKEKFLAAGVETVASSPEQFVATIKSDMAILGKVIKEAGIRAE